MFVKRRNRIISGYLTAGILCIGIFTYYLSAAGHDVEDFMKHKYSEKQTILAHHIKNNINLNIRHIEHLFDMLSETPLHKVVEVDQFSENYSDKIGKVVGSNPEFVTGKHFDSSDYLSLYITDRSGRPIIEAGRSHDFFRFVLSNMEQPTVRFDLTHRTAARNQIGFLKMAATDPEVTQANNAIDAFMPIYVNDLLKGWMVLRFRLAYIAEPLYNVTGGNDHNWIFDEHGTLVYCTINPAQEYHQLEIDKLVLAQPGEAVISSHGSDRIKDLLLTIPIVLGDNKWNIVVESEFDYVSVLINSQRNVLATLLVVLFGVAGLGIFAYQKNRIMEAGARQNEKIMFLLAESEKKYRAIFSASGDPVFLINRDMEITEVNERALLVFQTRREEMIGNRIDSILSLDAILMEKLDDIFVNGGEIRWNHTVETAQGYTVHFNGVYTGVKEPDNRNYVILIYLNDITEQKETELQLVGEKELLDGIVSSIGAGMAMYDQEMKLSWSNAIYGEIFRDAKDAEKFRIAGEHIMRKSFSEGISCSEDEAVEIGKEFRQFLVTTTPVFNKDGKVQSVIKLVVDITEQKKLQSQYQTAEKLASIGELVAGIAHEINNPLTGIIGYSQLISEDAISDTMKDDALKIMREAQRCSKIIQNLLKFSSKTSDEKQPFKMHEALIASLDIISYELSLSGIKITREIAQKLPPVYGNFHEIQQVFLNIITNANYFLKKTAGPRELRIRISESDKDVVTEIENTGEKIPEGNIEKIFDPFYTSKKFGEGTGLGLSISHGIVAAHGGALAAKNTDDGVSFSVSLPIFSENNETS